jgi:hypothetical protein
MRRTSNGNIQPMPKKEILDFKPVWRLAQSGDERRKRWRMASIAPHNAMILLHHANLLG